RADHPAFVSAAGFDTDRAGADRAQPAAQLTPARGIVADTKERSIRIHSDVEPLLRNIDSHTGYHLCHIFYPCLVVRGRAHATVRACEETAWAPCSPTDCSSLVRYGLQAVPGDPSPIPRHSPFCPIRKTQGGWQEHRGRGRRWRDAAIA